MDDDPFLQELLGDIDDGQASSNLGHVKCSVDTIPDYCAGEPSCSLDLSRRLTTRGTCTHQEALRTSRTARLATCAQNKYNTQRRCLPSWCSDPGHCRQQPACGAGTPCSGPRCSHASTKRCTGTRHSATAADSPIPSATEPGLPGSRGSTEQALEQRHPDNGG